MTDFSQYKLSCKPDRQDRRDLYKNRRYNASYPPVLPTSYTLSYLPPIKDQGQTESCTSHSFAFFSECLLASRSNQYVKLSPFYVWYYGRLEEGTQLQDTGIQMRSIMDAGHTYGICEESFWPFGTDFTKEPDAIAQVNALFKLPCYERCETLTDIKYALAIEHLPVCIGVEVMDTWYDSSVQENGIIKYDPKSKVEGGHAVTGVGFTSDYLMIANSWGTSYGKDGFIYLPWEYLTNTWFDCWTAGYDTLPQSNIA